MGRGGPRCLRRATQKGPHNEVGAVEKSGSNPSRETDVWRVGLC